MIQKKVCMLGTFAVGKTSLVRRFVESIYSDKYITTVGVKIDKKVVKVNDKEVTLMLWDLEGSQSEHDLRTSYLRGASGYFVVADGTRPDTLYSGLALQKKVTEALGEIPFVFVINKIDLTDQWGIKEREISALNAKGWQVILTSAKTGLGVEDGFHKLAQRVLEV